MGATVFDTYALGKTVGEAFRSAREEAQYDYGHAGYTGTIAEKGDYVFVTLPARVSVEKFFDWLRLAEDAQGLEWAREELARAEAWLKAAKPGTIRQSQARVRRAKDSIKRREKEAAKFAKAVGPNKALVEEYLTYYDDKWGPCLAFEVTGTKAKEYKERRGRKGTRDKVFRFAGYASC